MLRELVLARHACSKGHLGFDSFAHRTLADKMVQDPDEVSNSKNIGLYILLDGLKMKQ